MWPGARDVFLLCAACVSSRGLERGDAFERIHYAPQAKGRCDDCGCNFAELEGWRRRSEPRPTLPMLPDERAVLKGKDR